MGLVVPDRRVEPVPGRGRVDEIESRTRGIPALEGCDMNPGRVPTKSRTCSAGQIGAELDASDVVATTQKCNRRFPGAASDLQ
jgi:hypothetical protein